MWYDLWSLGYGMYTSVINSFTEMSYFTYVRSLEKYTTKHEAELTTNTSTYAIELTYTKQSFGKDIDGTFVGMPSGDSIIYILGYA